MSDDRRLMTDELKKTTLPVLKQKGFKGSFPHFRRISDDKIDLLMFQFDKYGGGFIVEISFVITSETDKYVFHWRKGVAPEKLTVADAKLRKRFPEANTWFYYWDLYEQKTLFGKNIIAVNPEEKFHLPEKYKLIKKTDENIYKELSEKAVSCIEEAERYWENPDLFNKKKRFRLFGKNNF
ncbi:MAG: DUF4304 domain-containing protein [Ignavibacteria bacterium]|nr:DUF4304 domain-containing protein [Ignavibacteria bacterium]